MREEILAAEREIARGNPWYTSNQIRGQRCGVYRRNMKLRYEYAERLLNHLSIGVEGKTVVDVGCGDGQWSMEIVKHHPMRLIGVDYNHLRLDRYQQNILGSEAIFGSCLDIPLDNNFADVVMFHQVLEHVREPLRALQEVHRILKPGGWLILSVPNEGTWLKHRVQYRFIEPRALQMTDHVNFFTQSSLKRLLERSSFRVGQLDTLGFYFPHNGISRRLVGRSWSFKLGVLVATVIPVLRDCIFAWCQPVKTLR